MKPVTLAGSIVRLEPLLLDHVDGLMAINDPELWRWTVNGVASRAEMIAYVGTAMAWQDAGTALPFATVLRSEDRVIGSTRFANFERANFKAEIGWTFLSPRWQRTGANIEAKLLMMTHGFEVLGLNRIEFKTDALNDKSRTALRGIGAIEEGILRSHQVTWNGRRRDSVYYSVLKEEWENVRNGLVARLENRNNKTVTGKS